MKSGLFVTGTDTGIGKTVVSSLLVSALKVQGIEAGYFKPVQTGEDSDTQTVSQLAELSSAEVAQPVYQFRLPQAPSRAAQAEGQQIQLDLIQRHWQGLSEKVNEKKWVVEGAGGPLVPLNSKRTIRDLVLALGLKLVLVSSTRLGTINHTLLSLEAAVAAGIEVAGIVFVGDEDPGLISTLQDFSKAPILAQIPKVGSVSPEWIQETAIQQFPLTTLKRLYAL